MNQVIGGGNAGYFQMMVPGHKVGLIIGKGGETIKNLQESTGARVVIVQVFNAYLVDVEKHRGGQNFFRV